MVSSAVSNFLLENDLVCFTVLSRRTGRILNRPSAIRYHLSGEDGVCEGPRRVPGSFCLNCRDKQSMVMWSGSPTVTVRVNAHMLLPSGDDPLSGPIDPTPPIPINFVLQRVRECEAVSDP